jgi:four helix bundle protein
MSEWVDRLEDRTRAFATAVVKLTIALDRAPGCGDICRQLARSSGSVAANHRAMRRGRSAAEFRSKLQTVDEEADECVLWLEMLQDLATGPTAEIERLLNEARQLRAIFATAKATTRRKRPRG